MPSITPQVRATIGGSPEDFKQPRAQVKAATGMTLPEVKETSSLQQESDKNGQPVIKEEDKAPEAVTLSPQLTALARKQQKLQAEIQAQRDKESEWAKKQADFVPKSELQAKLKGNPSQALSELGISYQELTEALLAESQGEDPVKKLEAKLNQLEKTQEESVSKQYEATLKQYRAEAKSLIEANPKAYHFIKSEDKTEAIVQHIVETWKENPDQVLTIDQAAKEIEEFLRADAKEKADRLKELEPPKEEEEPAKKTLPPPQRTAAKTLTEQVSSAPTRTQNMFQHLSMKERIQHAVARAQK